MSIWISDLLSCQRRQVGPKSEERCAHWIQERRKRICGPKDKKFILRRDVAFDEASMMNPTNSQEVESETIDRISQQVENDDTSPSLEKLVSIKIISTGTNGDDHVADQDAGDDED